MYAYPAGTISMTVANDFISGAAKRRVECEAINTRVGIPQAMLADSTKTMPLAAFTAMLEIAAYESGQETLGLDLGDRQKLSVLGQLGVLLESADTLGSALEKFNRYFGVIQTNTRKLLNVSNGVARLSYLVTDPAARFRAQDAAFTIAQHYSMIRLLLGFAPRLIGVDFEHSLGDSIGRYGKHFSAPVRCNQPDNALLFPADLLRRPIASVDRKIHSEIEAEIAEAEHRDSLRFGFKQSAVNWLTASISLSAPTNIEFIARDFGMSARSFRRKLADCGVTYLDIREQVRLTIAKCMLLETSQPITSLALKLGYSETSAFCRNFKSQTGATPAAFRLTNRQ